MTTTTHNGHMRALVDAVNRVTPVNTHRDRLLALFDLMKRAAPEFKDMEATVEASPWHREANVLVHTEMVVNEYVRLTDADVAYWSRDDFLGGVACIFHDIGKPAAKVEKYREDRGHYFAFHGHESISSRTFESYACDQLAGEFTASEIFRVCWMIEHHMPWDVTDKTKRSNLALTAKYLIDLDVYTRALLADQRGRIADDAEAKNKRADEWIGEFRRLADSLSDVEIPGDDDHIMYVLIGASGSGKSTIVRLTQELMPTINVFSLDELRHRFYNDTRSHEGYRSAFEQSINDPTFNSRADSEFTRLIREKKHLVVDNTNVSVKRRGAYITQARRNGYKVVAITMPISVEEVVRRQSIRDDKSVPEDAVRRQYASIQQPSLGEFDLITPSSHNLDTASQV